MKIGDAPKATACYIDQAGNAMKTNVSDVPVLWCPDRPGSKLTFHGLKSKLPMIEMAAGDTTACSTPNKTGGKKRKTHGA